MVTLDKVYHDYIHVIMTNNVDFLVYSVQCYIRCRDRQLYDSVCFLQHRFGPLAGSRVPSDQHRRQLSDAEVRVEATMESQERRRVRSVEYVNSKCFRVQFLHKLCISNDTIGVLQ